MATLSDIRNTNWQLSAYNAEAVVQGFADLQQCLETLLYTQKGTAVLRPNYGIDLLSYLDRPISEVIPELKREIIQQVETYEPRVEIESITMEIVDVSNLVVSIYWKPVNSTAVQNTAVTYNIVS